MLTSYSGDNYKDAEKVNSHIKEVAVERLPVNTSFDELNPPLTPGQKLYILQSLGFKPQQNDDRIVKGQFFHPVFGEGHTITFDLETEDLSKLINKSYRKGYTNRMNEERFSQQKTVAENKY